MRMGHRSRTIRQTSRCCPRDSEDESWQPGSQPGRFRHKAWDSSRPLFLDHEDRASHSGWATCSQPTPVTNTSPAQLLQRLAVIRRAAHVGVQDEAVHVGAQVLMELRLPWHRALHSQHLQARGPSRWRCGNYTLPSASPNQHGSSFKAACHQTMVRSGDAGRARWPRSTYPRRSCLTAQCVAR